MIDELVSRWMKVVPPPQVKDLMGPFMESFAKKVGIPGSDREDIQQKLAKVDQKEIDSIVAMYAQEHFSPDALQAAVVFFESPLGAKYMEERVRIAHGARQAVMHRLVQSLKEGMGG